MTTHEVYLSQDVLEARDNGRFQWLCRQIHERIGVKVQEHLHLTIAFATKMPMEKVDEVIRCTPQHHMEPLEFDRVRILNARTPCLILECTNVPESWHRYVSTVKDMMQEKGCEVSYPDSFVAHITLHYHVPALGAPQILGQVSKELRPISFKFTTPFWTDRSNHYTRLFARQNARNA